MAEAAVRKQIPVLSFLSAVVWRESQGDEFHITVNTSLECSVR